MRAPPYRPLFGPWPRRLLIAAAFLSVGAAIATLLYGSRLSPLRPGPTDAYGFGPLGHHAFAEMLKGMGMHVMLNRGDRFDGPTTPMIFAEPSLSARVEGKVTSLSDALRLREEATLPTLVVLPKWRLGPTNGDAIVSVHPGAEAVLDVALPPDYVTDAPRTFLVEASSDDQRNEHRLYGVLGEYTVAVPRLQVLLDPPAHSTVLLKSAFGAVVVLSPAGTLVVSEPDLMHNYNLHRADNAALWWAVLSDYNSDTVVLDEAFHGHGKAHKLGAALGEFPAVLLVIHLLLLLLLFVLAGSKRFGPPLANFDSVQTSPASYEPPMPPTGQVAHGPAAAIGVAAHVLADGQKLGDLAHSYVAQLLLDLSDRLQVASGAPLANRAQAIDALATHRGRERGAVALLERARALGESPRKRQQDAAVWELARDARAFRANLLDSPQSSSTAADSPADSPSNPQGPVRPSTSSDEKAA